MRQLAKPSTIADIDIEQQLEQDQYPEQPPSPLAADSDQPPAFVSWQQFPFFEASSDVPTLPSIEPPRKNNTSRHSGFTPQPPSTPPDMRRPGSQRCISRGSNNKTPETADVLDSNKNNAIIEQAFTNFAMLGIDHSSSFSDSVGSRSNRWGKQPKKAKPNNGNEDSGDEDELEEGQRGEPNALPEVPQPQAQPLQEIEEPASVRRPNLTLPKDSQPQLALPAPFSSTPSTNPSSALGSTRPTHTPRGSLRPLPPQVLSNAALAALELLPQRPSSSSMTSLLGPRPTSSGGNLQDFPRPSSSSSASMLTPLTTNHLPHTTLSPFPPQFSAGSNVSSSLGAVRPSISQAYQRPCPPPFTSSSMSSTNSSVGPRPAPPLSQGSVSSVTSSLGHVRPSLPPSQESVASSVSSLGATRPVLQTPPDAHHMSPPGSQGSAGSRGSAGSTGSGALGLVRPANSSGPLAMTLLHHVQLPTPPGSTGSTGSTGSGSLGSVRPGNGTGATTVLQPQLFALVRDLLPPTPPPQPAPPQQQPPSGHGARPRRQYAGLSAAPTAATGTTSDQLVQAQQAQLQSGDDKSGTVSKATKARPKKSTRLDAPGCTHTDQWKRLRSKKGHGHYVCQQCGLKWRSNTGANKDANGAVATTGDLTTGADSDDE